MAQKLIMNGSVLQDVDHRILPLPSNPQRPLDNQLAVSAGYQRLNRRIGKRL